MPTPPSKTLSPAELAKLEHAFATNPASESYKPLAEAYLAMSRFMEAMVVCKKGAKAHPQSAEPRLLLARVYAAQGKDRKAIEELTQALQIAPGDKVALRSIGVLQLRAGEPEAGKASLLKAYEGDPRDEETIEAMKQWDVPVPAPAVAQVAVAAGAPTAYAQPAIATPPQSAPPSPTHASPPTHVVTAPGGLQSAPAPRARPAAPPVLQTVRAQPAPPVALRSAPAPTRAQPPRPAPQAAPRWQPDDEYDSAGPTGEFEAAGPTGEHRTARPSRQSPAARAYAPARAPAVAAEFDPSGEYAVAETVPPRSARKSRGSRSVFLTLVVLAPLTIAAYAGFSQWQVRKNRAIKKALDAATEQLKHDSYASYKLACEAAERALEMDDDSVAAHGYLAYAWAIRWGEHGGGDDARRKAEEHLAEAKDEDELSSHLFAAEALFKTYAGDGRKALEELRQRTSTLEASGKRSSLLALTLGLIEMNAGDLDAASQSLEKAQALAPDDPRVYSAMGTLLRRKGQDEPALKSYQFALKYEKDHPEALLGTALLLLEQEDANRYVAAAKMIRKLVEADPPPSPRQLATAHLARAFLVSRVSNEVGYYKPSDQRELLEGTGVPADKKAAGAELAKAEDLGFSLDRQNPELYLIKGRRLMLEGDLDDAVTQIRSAIKLDPMRAQLYVELARALMAKPGGEKEATEALVTAIKTMGQSPKLLLMLGTAYQRQGDLDRAIDHYLRAIGDGKARAGEARLALGAAYRQKKDFARAQEQLEKATTEFVGQPARLAAAFTELGRTLEEKGERPRAAENFEKAIKADEEYAEAYYWFARHLSEERGSDSKARLAAQEYLKREPRGAYAADAQRFVQ